MKRFENSWSRWLWMLPILTTVSATLSANGQPVYNPENGHYYELVTDAALWSDAKAAAEASVFQARCGFLATITSASENNFVVENVIGDVANSAWIGGFQPVGSPEPGEGWRWLTGESFDYENWGPGQPDQNGGEDENAIELKGLTSSFPYAWHDQAGDTDLFPYVVEYAPIYNPENGHYYELVVGEELWPVARASAEMRVFKGLCGRLASITSVSENNFVVENVIGDVANSAWIGGFQPVGSPEPGEGWRWLTGESFDYENWGPGQPDQNGGEDENAIELKGLTSSFPYAWHDQAGDTDLFPYVVEYGHDPSCPGDADCNGLVDTFDLVKVILDWGTDGTANGGDVNGSGLVDVADLVAVVLAWGPCL